VLEARLAQMTERFADGPVPLPPHWGGFLLRPETIEFWQGRPNRLHDRFRYQRDKAGAWTIERLAP
jgi:pyridoxamine 5'-phosphate oxidase